MKVTYLGHSCFLLEGSPGAGAPAVRVLTDPYQHGAYDGGVKYRPLDREADVVTVSHAHPDHSFASGVPGKPVVVSAAGEHRAGGVAIRGVAAFHDEARGSKRGKVVAFRFELDGWATVHLGDLGHLPDPAMVSALSPVDLLLLPVGGTFTLGPEEAGRAMELLSPRVTIPMHYKTAGVDFPILPVEEFLRGREGVARLASSTLDLAAGAPLPGKIVVLRPALLP